MEKLRATGLADRTIVVFTSDHGELAGSHALEEKQYPFEESAGVPLIVWGPGCGIPASRVVTAPSCTEDLFPTLLGLAGLVPHSREPLHGADLSSLIRGHLATVSRPGVMLEFVAELRPDILFNKRVYRGFRSARHKYVVFGGGKEGLKPWQFFDLENDPGERHNRVNDPACAELVRQHHGWLRDRMIETVDDAPLAPAFGFHWLNRWAECRPRAPTAVRF